MLRLVWLTAFGLNVLLANIFLDHFISLPWFGLFSVGSIFFAAAFTLRDRLHSYGLPTVYLGIALALVVNTVYGQWIAEISPRFIFASFLAILISELTNTAIFQRLRHKHWGLRVFSCHAVSVPVDSFAFTFLAFYGVMSTYDISQILFVDILGKYLVAMLIAWIPYLAFFSNYSYQNTQNNDKPLRSHPSTSKC